MTIPFLASQSRSKSVAAPGQGTTLDLMGADVRRMSVAIAFMATSVEWMGISVDLMSTSVALIGISVTKPPAAMPQQSQ
jgi:hypothetical protein